jgi:carbonic anhydrase
VCLVVAACLLVAGVLQAAEHGHEAPKGMAPAEAAKMLMEGNDRYVSGNLLKDPGVDAKARQELTKGQHPFAIILTCSDSRVPPELIFNQGLGKLFVARVAGNLIDPALLGSIEYGVLHLGTRYVMVLGHESCGAVTATAHALEQPGKAESPNIEDLVVRLTPAVKKAEATGLKGKELVEAASAENAKMVAGQITAQSPAIAELVKKGEVKIVPAKYFLGTGKVQVLE